MSIDEQAVAMAVDILRGKYHSGSDAEAVFDYLVGYPPFDKLDDDDLEPIIAAALRRLPAQAAGARPQHGRPAPTRPDPGVTPQAPFRFVVLPDQVVLPEADVGPLDQPIPGGVCADIDVTWVAETPLLIGDEKNGVVQPLRMGETGGYVIPGASLRGMLRAAVEIVAHGRLGAANLHHRFKVPHERSVRQILADTQSRHLPQPIRKNGEVVGYDADFVENLFGYVIERDALGLAEGERVAPDVAGRKGRIAVGFARLEGEAQVSEPVTTVAMAPRASFAPFYLKSPKEKDYSAEPCPQLAGRKRYLPRYRNPVMAKVVDDMRAMGQRQLQHIEKGSRSHKVSTDVQTRLAFLLPKPGAELRFSGRIRLHNVTRAELGAVLFALTHGGDPDRRYRHMIGRAKPFGAGQVRVAAARLTVVANDDGVRTVDAEHRPYLDAFIEFMKKQTGLSAFPHVPAVEEFLGASDPAAAPDGLDYLPLQAFKAIRDAVKPRKRMANGAPPPPPRDLPGTSRDGRLLPAPTRKFWR